MWTTPFPFDLPDALRTGLFISGTSGSGKTNLAKLITWLLIKAGVVVYVIDPSQAWRECEALMQINVIDKPKGQVDFHTRTPTVFDISLLYVKDQRKFTEGLCRTIFENWVKGHNGSPCFIFFEEAQLYLPLGRLRSNVAQEIMRLVTTGRNYNLRFGLITQFASMVDKTPVKMSKQRYFGYTDEYNDMNYIENFIGRDNVLELPDLQIGEFMYDYGKTTLRIKTPEFQPRLLNVPIFSK